MEVTGAKRPFSTVSSCSSDEAASCLEQGNLWTEAIAIYEELGHFEKAGDLYTRLDQLDRAHAVYRKAVNQHLARKDRIAAALVLSAKLANDDGAIDCLEAGWPSSMQAGESLEELFQFLGRLGRHEAALVKVEQLRQDGAPQSQRVSAQPSFSSTALGYPNPTVQDAAADAVRTMAAQSLFVASPGQTTQILSAVRRLVPSDRLLGRDCDRFARRRPQPVVAKGVERGPAALQPKLLQTLRIPPEVEWRSAVSAGSVFYAAGYRGNRLEVIQYFWNENFQRLEGDGWPIAPASCPPILLACDEQASNR